MVGLAGWNLLILFVYIVPLVLWIIALVQVTGSRASGSIVALWIIIVTLLPVVGPILWFAIGRKTARQAGPGTPTTS
jgi:hypothetical protein